jgi:hypothetical protein
MKKILLNYDYGLYPFTTASYLEMAGKRMDGLKVFRLGEIDPDDVDLIINVMPFNRLVVSPKVPSCYWEIDCHLIQGRNTDIYSMVDRVYIAQSPFLPLYPEKKTKYLPLACDPLVHHRIYGVKEKYDIGFIGNDSYPKRRRLLDQLETKYKVLRTQTPPGIPYSRALSQCRLSFNCSLNNDVNMRFFESLAIGRLLLTDYLPAQDEFAKRGVHYDTYEDWPDLDRKVSWYLEHPKEREKMATWGAIYTLRHHTYEKRLKTILEDFGWTGF